MFDHYVAVDWALSNMAIAKMTKVSNKITVVDVPSNLKEFKLYLAKLKGSIILTFEETTTSRWLYTELHDCVDRILVCDPYRNKLLSEGAKTDKIDAEKLVKLLKADFLKEVFHTNNDFIEIRKIVSAYEDLIKAGVRLKNQRSALFRAKNKNHKLETTLDNFAEKFVLEGIDKNIKSYEKEKLRYLSEFKRLKKKHKEIKLISEIPGIGEITAVQVVSRVVDASRFKKRNHFLSYCGLIRHSRISGGKTYGKKTPRFCRMMKGIIKIATTSTMKGNNEFFHKYNYLIMEKNYSARDARTSVARQIATVVYAVLKNKSKYDPFKNRKINYVTTI